MVNTFLITNAEGGPINVIKVNHTEPFIFVPNNQLPDGLSSQNSPPSKRTSGEIHSALSVSGAKEGVEFLTAGITQLNAHDTNLKLPFITLSGVQGKLRIGLAEQTVIVALAHAVLLHRDGADGTDLAARLEQSAQAVKMAYSQCPSWDVLLPALLEHGPVVRERHTLSTPI